MQAIEQGIIKNNYSVKNKINFIFIDNKLSYIYKIYII